MKTHKYTIWVIDTNESGLIGRFWQFAGKSTDGIPRHLLGCHFALFDTCKEAREFGLPSVKKSFPKARIVRVTVTIKKEKSGKTKLL